MSKIRTRFAPSPTGYMHIGNLRTALYAYLIAKKDNGDFIIRIEDTDQNRQVEGAVDIIFNTLKQCGLNHDEGPDVGGNYGPYVQSDRMKMGVYKQYAHKLVEMGKAHVCFCKEEDIQAQKEASENVNDSFFYKDPCKNLSKEEVEKRISDGELYVIRQNVDPNGTTSFDDEVYGTITVDNSSLDEMILLKSDGYPTYNFANVIDDHMMEITDVVRGNEYLSSTPKYNLIYEAFGWDIPRYIHCPPVMKDEQHKLSKRNGDASFQDLIEKGYLPDAVLNYIALLGWAPSEEREVYSLSELCEAFDVKRIGTSGAIFDIEKLKWMNGVYIRELPFDEYFKLVEPYIAKVVDPKYDYKAISVPLQERLTVLTDAEELVDFYNAVPEYSEELYLNKKAKTTDLSVAKKALEICLPVLESIEEWNGTKIYEVLSAKAAEEGMKNITLMYPLQIAVSGKTRAPGGATVVAEILGKEETIKRVQDALIKLS